MSFSNYQWLRNDKKESYVSNHMARVLKYMWHCFLAIIFLEYVDVHDFYIVLWITP